MVEVELEQEISKGRLLKALKLDKEKLKERRQKAKETSEFVKESEEELEEMFDV